MSKGLIYGYCDIKITAWHMEICDITVFQKDGKFSFAMPSREFTTQDGTKGYKNYIKFEKEVYFRLQNSIANSLEEYLKQDSQVAEPEGLPF